MHNGYNEVLPTQSTQGFSFFALFAFFAVQTSFLQGVPFIPPVVSAVPGGFSNFPKPRPDKTFQAVVKEAYDYAVRDLGLEFPGFTAQVDGSVASYFSDHFSRQLM